MLWLNIIVEIGAIAGLTSVILVMLMSQPRIFFAMAEDGLFPQFARKIQLKYKTPWITILLSGTVCAVMGRLLPIGILAEMTSIGTLFAFFLVNLSVPILRQTWLDAPRRFKVPLGPYVVPMLGAAISLLLIATATLPCLIRFVAWMLVGIIVYFSYGYQHSIIGNRGHHKSYQDHPFSDMLEKSQEPLET